jgi:hypothetical protein
MKLEKPIETNGRKDPSPFYSMFLDIMRSSLGSREEIPIDAEEQASILLKVIHFLAECKDAPDFMDKVFMIKAKFDKATALDQEPIDELGKAMKEFGAKTDEQKTDEPKKESPDEDEPEEKEEDKTEESY